MAPVTSLPSSERTPLAASTGTSTVAADARTSTPSRWGALFIVGVCALAVLGVLGSVNHARGTSQSLGAIETSTKPFVQQKCGCAAQAPAGSKSCSATTKEACGTSCTGGGYGCDAGICPFPGVNRDGMCLDEGGTHKVCGKVSKDTLHWFEEVGNDLSSVVSAGGGWCLCKHWLKGAICNHADTKTSLPVTFAASDINDPEVMQIKRFYEGSITKDQLCNQANGAVAGGSQ